MAEENPLETTECSLERADPLPETIRWKADTAASRREEAIFTIVALMPFQTEDAVCFIADQIWETAFLILFQILDASEASWEKFPVTTS